MKKKIEPSDSDLFDLREEESSAPSPESSPLAVRMRPRTLEEIAGQPHLLGEGKLLRRTIQSGHWSSMIFYGPPGSGKTTLAHIISRVTHSKFVPLNAVASNVSELRRIIEEAKKNLRAQKIRTILFIDEIHRFNKAQQDVLMPDVESGQIVLIGATTHNPSFSINGPLLSRSTIFELRPLEEEDLKLIVHSALKDLERGFGGREINLSKEALDHIVKSASGDARRALNALEVGVLTTPQDSGGVIQFDAAVAQESSQRKIVYYDRDEDYHYDTASAFIKSIRGSDVDASVYWLAKMIYAGEDIRFMIRRLLILASEDIGNADPQALILAAAGLQAVEFVGMPEARIILSQLVTYLALAPKSNASYSAISKALEDVKEQKIEEVPAHLRDASYHGAKKLGHGQGYRYTHTDQSGAPQIFLPKSVRYYEPGTSGFEKILSERLSFLKSKQ